MKKFIALKEGTNKIYEGVGVTCTTGGDWIMFLENVFVITDWNLECGSWIYIDITSLSLIE